MIKSTTMLLQEYYSYSNPEAKIKREVDKGNLTHIVRGLYETNKLTPGHYLADIICSPSYLSFEFALAWYDLIPEAVYTYTSASYMKNRRKQYKTPFGFFTYQDIPNEAFPFETILHVENDYSFIIASPEKAICDQLYICAPCSNRKELQALLFDDLRIDDIDFKNTDLKLMKELAGLYHTTNHRLLISFIDSLKRHHSST